MKLFLGGLTAVMLGLAGCATVPHTGRSQLMLYGEDSDISAGRSAWVEVQSQSKRSTNAEYNAALARVGRNIAAAANKTNYDWEFVVFESAEPNAFALPGGKVAVYSGLFTLCDNDAELATVVGHEVSHALARHGMERSSQDIMRGIGGEVVAAAAGSDWSPAYNATTQLAAMLPFSREQEYEADYLGLLLMAQAGYDPQNAIAFWDKFGRMNKVGTVGEFLSTHPDGEKRLKKLRDALDEANRYYEKSPKIGKGPSITVQK